MRADIDVIAAFTETPGAGTDRPTFSPGWRAARDYVARQAEAAGCKVRVDAAGNLHARHRDIPWQAPVWLSGSHIDSVPNGGNFDGVAGVVIPLEILRTQREPIPLELIIFAEEEGTTFGLGMLGSRAWTGELSARELEKVRNALGENYFEAGGPHDVRAAMLLEDKFDPHRYFGLIEAHVEQGPGMWKRDDRVAIVTAIAGRKQYKVHVKGEANHAGSTSMDDRKDALVAAATCVLQLEGIARGIGSGGGGSAVMTVGRMHVRPNAINVIPAGVDFTIDFRSASNDVLAEGDGKIRQVVAQTCERRGLTYTLEATESAPAVAMDLRLCQRLERCAAAAGITAPPAVSGALHDAAVVAPHLPTAMVFIASRDGISHNPAEFSRIEDIALAARVIDGVVTQAP